jgi:uncharacterized membrane protein YoaK (UPF0700 family)
MSATVPVVSSGISPRPSPIFGTPGADLMAAGILSAVAGYVDAAGFLGLFGLFTAHVTGDLVAAGTTLGDGLQDGMVLRLGTIVVFMTSVVTAAVVARAMRRRGHRPLTALFALMTLSLAIFCASGVMLRSRLQGPDHWAVALTGAAGVFGMGVQNALMRDALSSLGPTTLMTGNLTQLMLDLVDVALPDNERGAHGEGASPRTELHRRLTKSATSVSAFLFGTVLGGVATTVFGFWSIALPATVIGSFTVSTWLQSHAPAAHRLRDRAKRSVRRSGIQRRLAPLPDVDQLGGTRARPAATDLVVAGDERGAAVADLDTRVGGRELRRVLAELPIAVPVHLSPNELSDGEGSHRRTAP